MSIAGKNILCKLQLDSCNATMHLIDKIYPNEYKLRFLPFLSYCIYLETFMSLTFFIDDLVTS